jgi:alpha-D-xyloside xylohydrolase
MFLNRSSLTEQDGYNRLETFSYLGDAPRGAKFETQAGTLEVSYFADGVLRLRMANDSKPDYGLVIGQPDEMLDVHTYEPTAGYCIEAGEYSLELSSSPVRLIFKKGEEVIFESITDRGFLGGLSWMPFAHSDEGWLASFALASGSPVYGLGEKFGPLNRRGQLVDSWNSDATTVNSELSYKNAPFAWSPDGWGLFVNTPSRVIHGVGYPQWSHRTYILKVHDQELDLFLISGDTPAEILEKYTFLTGRSPLPPRWSYGVWMSRAYYKTADEILKVAKKLRKHKIPCDTLTLDGRAWHKMETRFDFQWDEDRYPDPAGFVAKLKKKNFHLCLWEYPYLSTRNPLFNKLAAKGYFLKNSAGKPYIHKWLPYPFDAMYPHLLPSGIIDMTNPEAYTWYRDAHKQLFDIGVSVMKPDYGESIPEDVVAHNGDSGSRLHNVYALLYNQCCYEAAQKYAPDEALVWSRAGWVGSQRYPIQWGGDPQVDWEGMVASIRGGLSWGMSGGAYYSHDVGGFAVGDPDPELYIRWAQAGAMMSHTRFHGQGQREPWHYGEEAERIVRDWLNFRYRLIPYLQACALQANRSGLPFMRSMVLAFPEDRLAWGFEEQYLLGPSLLVIPVTNPGGKTRYYLPSGSWFHIQSGERFEGPAVMEETVPLEYIPIFGREGTLLPLGPAVQHTGELEPDVHLEEIWAFGKVDEGIELPGLSIDIGDAGELSGLPVNVNIKNWR